MKNDDRDGSTSSFTWTRLTEKAKTQMEELRTEESRFLRGSRNRTISLSGSFAFSGMTLTSTSRPYSRHADGWKARPEEERGRQRS
jgi:hypothetical protein